jgi:hypothetical protein
MSNEKKARANRETRKLAKAHEHRGIVHPAGAEIDLLPHQAERLEKREIITPKGAPVATS